jgi:pyrrolidone-carboxylate peptidase
MVAKPGSPLTILLAGFAPSVRTPDDPSAALALALAGEKPGGATCVAAILPALWCGAPQVLDDAIARAGPDAVVMLGFCHAAAGFQVETRAHNRACLDEQDWTGRCWPGPRLAPGGPDALRVPLAETLYAGLTAVTPLVTLSDGTSGDVRNGALWSALYRASAPPVGYIALPQAAEGADAAGVAPAMMLTEAEIVRAVRHALAVLAEGTSVPARNFAALSSGAPSALCRSATARLRAATPGSAHVAATA